MKRANVGFEIIEAEPVYSGTEEIVIGYNPETEFYVCWYYLVNEDSYYWGDYSEFYENAKRSFIERISHARGCN